MNHVLAVVPHCVPLPVLNLVCGGVSATWSGLVSLLFSSLHRAVMNASVYALHGLGHAFEATTAVDLRAPWFTTNYHAMVAVSGLVGLFTLVLAAVDSVVRFDASVLTRAVLLHLPLAGLSVLVAVKIAVMLMTGVDGLIGAIDTMSGHPSRSLVGLLGHLIISTSGTVPGLFAAVVELIVLLGAVAMWFELLLRSAAIAITVLLFPLVLAAQVWPSFARHTKRVVEVLVALIVSKFVIAAVLMLGASALTNHAGVPGLLLGTTLVLFAAFSPFAVLRFIPLTEAVVVAGLEGHRQRITRVAMTSAQLGAKAAGVIGAASAAPLDQLVAGASLSQSTTPQSGRPPAGDRDLGGLVGVAAPPPRPPVPPRSDDPQSSPRLVIRYDATGPNIVRAPREPS